MDAQAQFPEVALVAQAIRAYLGRNPLASDTAAGIQRFWLPPQVGEVALTVVEAALAQLEADGVVHRLEQAWAPASYLSARAISGQRPQ